ncbi:MAG: AAA family ATPase [Lachnospiraceae bacterium]|nr:AAA family ATPase [Lachnospiraceae bacterium]
MAIRLWPQDYERKDHITKAEKSLLRNADRNFKNGHIVVGIDPLGMSSDTVKMGMYISPREGLITYSLYQGKIDFDNASSYKFYVEMVEEKIYNRLLDSKVLIVRSGEYKTLKFPYKHIIMFFDEKVGSVTATSEQMRRLLNYATYSFFRPITSKGNEKTISQLGIFDGIRKPYDSTFNEITSQECCAIFERLAPEYTVVMNETEMIHVPEKKDVAFNMDLRITGKEIEYKTFFLDEYQVAQVNDMGKGHRVILANPGAGKSVLLLSKAFKYASIYKDSNILLTCYNSNLADSYNFKRACANFGDNHNLYIMTFHKLVKKIYEECLHLHCESNIATEEEIKKCIRWVKDGKVSLKFKAIFIDEVQIFDPLYLELSYFLLDKNDPNHVFLMAGDLNQAVKKLSRKGDAPWKRIESVNLDFTGRVRYIEKNYRNSKGIAEYIANMLKLMNKRLSMLDLINSMEYEYNSFKIGDNSTVALKVKTGINRMSIKSEVAAAIKEISTKYNVSYSDIAVLFPYKKHSIVKYYFLYWIEEALKEAGIPYSLITSSEENVNERRRYSQTTGVVLSTIDSSLGLDFKAVIFAGLYPYNFVFGENGTKKEITSWVAIKNMTDEQQTKVQSQMRGIYTACSRARDVLYVLSDITPGTPMEEILKK